MLDGCTEAKTLTLDLGELVHNEYLDGDQPLDGGGPGATFSNSIFRFCRP